MNRVFVQYTEKGHFLLIHQGGITFDDKNDSLGLASLESESGLAPLLEAASNKDLMNQHDGPKTLAVKIAVLLEQYSSALKKYGNEAMFVPPETLKEELELPERMLISEFIARFATHGKSSQPQET